MLRTSQGSQLVIHKRIFNPLYYLPLLDNLHVSILPVRPHSVLEMSGPCFDRRIMWVPAAQGGNKVAVDSAEIEDLLKEYKLVSKVRG